MKKIIIFASLSVVIFFAVLYMVFVSIRNDQALVKKEQNDACQKQIQLKYDMNDLMMFEDHLFQLCGLPDRTDSIGFHDKTIQKTYIYEGLKLSFPFDPYKYYFYYKVTIVHSSELVVQGN